MRLGTLTTSFVLLSLVTAKPARSQVLWDQPNVPSVATAQGYTYKLYVTPSGQTNPTSTISLLSVTCSSASTVAPITANCTAPIAQATAVGATASGAKSELTSTDVAGGSAESDKSIPFIMPQATCSPNPVKLNVGTWSRSLPPNGIGQVLYNLRQSSSTITQVTISFNGMVQDVLQGTKLNNVAGSYFVAMVPKGSYQLTVEAADAQGCKDGGAARPMTVTVN